MSAARATALALVFVALVACSGAPDSGPSPTTAGSLPAPSNRAPAVTLSGGGACHPTQRPWEPVVPCEVRFEAVATDPDGDSLSFEWTGCASGTTSSATCVIDKPGVFEAVVRVSDTHGARTTAGAQARGVNAPPGARFGYGPDTLEPGQFATYLGTIEDEDVSCGSEWCRGARADGACSVVQLECSCRGGIELLLRSAEVPGLCHVELSLVDPWGLEGTASLDVPVS